MAYTKRSDAPSSASNSIALSAVELEELTMKPTPGRQRRVLDYVGIPYKVRPDGSLIVLRRDVIGAEAYDMPAAAQRAPQLRL